MTTSIALKVRTIYQDQLSQDFFGSIVHVKRNGKVLANYHRKLNMNTSYSEFLYKHMVYDVLLKKMSVKHEITVGLLTVKNYEIT